MKTKVLIVEDEKTVRNYIVDVVSSLTDIKIVGEAATVKEAEKLVDKYHPDIVLLDIEMPDGSGFNVVTRHKKPEFKTIVVTAHNRHAIQALKLAAVDYILKPFTSVELGKAIESTQTLIEENAEQYEVLKRYLAKSPDVDRLVIPSDSDKQTVLFEDIIYLRSDGGYSIFYLLGGGHIITSRPIAYYEEILPKNFFFRTHKSYMVNFMHVKLIPAGRGGNIPLTEGAVAHLSVRKAADFRKWFKDRTLN